MIEVFKTNIRRTVHAQKIIRILLRHFPGSKINIDLHDCDKVLRIEGCNVQPARVACLVQQNGFSCTELE